MSFNQKNEYYKISSLVKKLPVEHRQLKKQVDLLSSNKDEVSVDRLIELCQRQQAYLDFILDEEQGLSEHLRQLDSYQKLAMRGLSFMASGHELAGIFNSLRYYMKNVPALSHCQDEMHRLESLFALHSVQHRKDRFEHLSLKTIQHYLSGVFKSYQGMTMTFVGFDGQNVDFFMDYNVGNTILCNLVRNAMVWGDSVVEVKYLDGKIIVSDDGSGVPKEDQDLLFTLGHTKRNRGFGIGLFMSREYAKGSRSVLRYDSDNEFTDLSGASFVLEFGSHSPSEK